MVILGVSCILVKHEGYDVYGDKLATARIPEKCAVVKLEATQQRSTVRVDSGASRGGSEEGRAAAVLLMSKKSAVEIDDVIEMPDSGLTLCVTGRRSRYNVMGRLDHYEVEATVA